jgi:hypothetical protein
MDKLLNKVKSSLTTIATEKDFYNMIESRQDEVNDIVNKYICPLLMNDIAPDAPNEKVVQEINKYLDRFD